MTAPNGDNVRRRQFWQTVGIVVGTSTLALGVGITLWTRHFIRNDLVPLITVQLTESLERPVQIGPLEQVTLNSVRVGPSMIGATATDPTHYAAESVGVSFNLWKTLRSHKLDIDLTLVKTDAYLQQDAEKGWVIFEVPEKAARPEPFFEVRVDTINIRDSRVVALPNWPSEKSLLPIVLTAVNGTVDIEYLKLDGKPTQSLQFDLKARAEAGGSLALQGAIQPVVAKGQDSESISASISAQPKFARETNLAVQTNQVALSEVTKFTLATLGFQEAPIQAQAGRVNSNLKFLFRPDQPTSYSGTLRVADGTVQVDRLKQPLTQLDANVRLRDETITLDKATAQLGELTARLTGDIHLQDGYDLEGEVQPVTLAALAKTFDFKVAVPVTGTLASNMTITGALKEPLIAGQVSAPKGLTVDRLTMVSASTKYALQWPDRVVKLTTFEATPEVGGTLTGTGQVDFSQTQPRLALQVTGENLPADAIATLYDLKVPIRVGAVAATSTVLGSLNDLTTTVQWRAPAAQYPGQGIVSLKGNRLTFRETTVQVGRGTVSGSGQLVQGQWQAVLVAREIALNQFNAAVPGLLTGNFRLAGNTRNVRLDAIDGQGDFQIQQLASGRLRGTANLRRGRWDADVTASDLQLAQLATNLRGVANGQFQLSGLINNLSPTTLQARGNLALSAGLAAFGPQFASFNQPLTSNLAWNGRQLRIISARSDQLQASGTVLPQFDGFRWRGIEAFNLALDARQYPLDAGLVALPATVNVAGLASFQGTLTGSPSRPNLQGNLQLDQFAVNQLPFDSQLSGPVQYQAGSLALALRGSNDAIQVNYRGRRDFNFAINWQDAFAQGTTVGEVLTARLGNFPLGVLSLPPGGIGNLGPVRGTISAPDLQINLANRTLIGNVTIDNLGVGYLNVDQFAGQVRYANNLATLVKGQLVSANSFYRVNGRLQLGDNFAYTANIQTDQGEIQDLLTTLAIFELSDFSRGLTPPPWLTMPLPPTAIPTVLATASAGNANAPLWEQLRRLTELQTLENQNQAVADQAPLPPLSELSGPFAGGLSLSGSRQQGLAVDFDFKGEDWRWGEDYQAERVIAQGEYANGILVLEPLRFESTLAQSAAPAASASPPTSPTNTPEVLPAVAFVNLAGQFALTDITDQDSNLQLTAQNIDVDSVRNILNLPLNLDGQLQGTATLSGTLGNPQVRGALQLVNGAINREPLAVAQAQFLFQEARLSLLSSIQAENSQEPLQLSAQIPYAFRFMTVQPTDDRISLNIDVKDEGLALLNILNRQVSWESGKGTVNLAVSGTLQDPVVEGFATVEEGIVRARILPEPLTNLNGSARFARDRIIVDQLQGQFSNGQVSAVGTLPLLFPIITAQDLAVLGDGPTVGAEPSAVETALANLAALPVDDRPLTVNLDNIALTLKGVYDGRVDGQVVVGGSGLIGGPLLGGQVILSSGQIFLPENNTASASIAAADAVPAATVADTGGRIIVSRFENLKLSLGRSVQVIQGNLLNFFADGSLQLDGPITVSGIEPRGTIRLVTGRVNLFTTSFRLAGNDNTATFTPETGLTDPILKVNLRTSVAEATNRGPTTATAFASSEITDTSADPFATATGSLETIRIRASVEGPTSQLFQNLELSSSPPRTQNEIIGLIGGSFITALESGSSGDLSGVVNLFGGALLNRIQDFVTSTLNLSEFRLFPVTSASRFASTENTGSTLDIGTEIGFDVSDSFTVSVLKILTDSTPAEYNLRYRVTDSFTIRTTTNFGDLNRVLLEFETRF